MKTYIINPDTQRPVGIDNWRKDSDPARAELLALNTHGDEFLVFSKKSIGKYPFKEAQKAAADFHPTGWDGHKFRCPDRKEFCDLYDARFTAELDEAVALVKGDTMKKDTWYWTRNIDTDPRCSTDGAWYFNSYGNSSYNGFYNSCRVVPLTLCKFKKAERSDA